MFFLFLFRISKLMWIKLVEQQMNLSIFIMRQWIKEEGYANILAIVRTVLSGFCLLF